MAQGESARATCPKDILITLLNRGEMTFEEIVSALEDCYSRGTINKYLNELYTAGLITRKGRRGPYVLTSKGEKEAKHYKNIEKIKTYTLEEIERILEELEYEKLSNQVLYLRSRPLPEPAVRRKIEELGFNPEDFEFYNIIGFLSEKHFEEYEEDYPTDIELSKHSDVSEEDVESLLGVPESCFTWKPIAYNRKSRILFLGAYRKLIELEKQLREKRINMIKAEFNLSEEDVKKVDPRTLESMERIKETPDYWLYIASKKPNAFEVFLKHYMRLGYSEERARKMVEKDLEYYQWLEKIETLDWDRSVSP